MVRGRAVFCRNKEYYNGPGWIVAAVCSSHLDVVSSRITTQNNLKSSNRSSMGMSAIPEAWQSQSYDNCWISATNGDVPDFFGGNQQERRGAEIWGNRIPGDLCTKTFRLSSYSRISFTSWDTFHHPQLIWFWVPPRNNIDRRPTFSGSSDWWSPNHLTRHTFVLWLKRNQ